MYQRIVTKNALAAFACTASFIINAHAAEPKPVEIPAGELATALRNLASQTGVELFYPTELVRGLHTAGVSGVLTPEQAVMKLLQGTPLELQVDGSGAMLIAQPWGASGEAAAPEASTGKDPTQAVEITQARHSLQNRLRVAQAQGTTPAQISDDARTQAATIEEVVVTAQKKEERLIDTPQSVSVLSAEALNRLSATQFRDFANTVPGLSFTTAGAGNTQVSLRGVTIGQDLGATVGVYVDEAPYGSSQVFAFGPYLALDVGLFDIERIEVLRGPQGTLYGASTMGGLIKYVSKRPTTQELSGSIRTGLSGTKHGDINYDLAGAINVPLSSDKAALRASAFQSHDGGYIDNIAPSQRENANRSDINGGRLDLLLIPSEDLDIRLTGFAQNIARDGEATADYTFDGAMPIGSLNQNRLFDEPFDQRFRLASGTVVYDLGDAALTSISTYQTARTELTWDLSATYPSILFNVFELGPYSAVGNPNRSKTDKFSQEIRLASQGRATIEWVVGAFYTHEKSELGTEFLLRDLAGNPAPNTVFTYLAQTRFEEYAAFGDLTWRLTDKFDLTGGFRYARNDQQFTQSGSGTLGNSTPLRESDEAVSTYLASARYHLSDRATAYLRYATGYRPGGPNISTVASAEPTFESDSLKSYEIGLKAESFDRRFAVDLSGYFIDWNDIQMSVNVGGFTGYGNAADGATIRGAELSLTARPTSGLTLSGAFAFQDAQMGDPDPNLGSAEGERLPNVPRFTGTLDVDYELSMAALEPSLGATLRHVGERRSSFDGSLGFPQYRLPEYTVLDLRAGVRFGKIETRLYVHNATDERGQLSLFFAQFGARVAVLQPRTVGVTVTTSF